MLALADPDRATGGADPQQLATTVHIASHTMAVQLSLELDREVQLDLAPAGLGVEPQPGALREIDLDAAAREYLNQASRLLDLEESGVFRFWDADELSQLVREAGFRVLRQNTSFGSPPQAVVLTAARR